MDSKKLESLAHVVRTAEHPVGGNKVCPVFLRKLRRREESLEPHADTHVV